MLSKAFDLAVHNIQMRRVIPWMWIMILVEVVEGTLSIVWLLLLVVIHQIVVVVWGVALPCPKSWRLATHHCVLTLWASTHAHRL